MNEYPWMEIARSKLGEHEIPGPAANPDILEFLASTTLDGPDKETDETPWCSAFVNWCVEQAGFRGTDSAWARSWLKWGREPATEDEWKGCIVVLSRGANSGHVGFMEDWNDDQVKLLAGNQGDAVSEAWFPIDRVLGYRVPA